MDEKAYEQISSAFQHKLHHWACIQPLDLESCSPVKQWTSATRETRNLSYLLQDLQATEERPALKSAVSIIMAKVEWQLSYNCYDLKL